jgi:hypothetical protein
VTVTVLVYRTFVELPDTLCLLTDTNVIGVNLGICVTVAKHIWFGAYNIYELNHVNSGDKKQFIFPAVKNVQIDKVGTKVTIDMHPYSNRDTYASLSVKIPKQLLNGIFQVLDNSTKMHTNQPSMIITSEIDNSNGAYTLLNIHLSSGEDLRLSIVGKKAL